MSLIGIASNEIFIVDDDAEVCDSLSMLFTLEGYRVTTFRDGTSFIAAARTRSPVCVLLDVHMPGKSGLDLLEELEAGNYPAPIFIMSSRRDIPTAVEAIRRGAYDFIEKRLDIDAMLARVREAIDNWARRRQQVDSGGDHLSFPGCDRLTPREREVLSQIAAAATSNEVAKTLGISRRSKVEKGFLAPARAPGQRSKSTKNACAIISGINSCFDPSMRRFSDAGLSRTGHAFRRRRTKTSKDETACGAARAAGAMRI